MWQSCGDAALGQVLLRWPSSISSTIFWLPRLYTAPHFLGFRIPVYIGVLAGVGMELIAFAVGALIHTSLATHSSSWPRWPRTILIIRWIFGLCSIEFGVNHLMSIKDNLVYVPKWMPLGSGSS